jgi:transcriptional regulator with GAF, ATPase, and Fis domain
VQPEALQSLALSVAAARSLDSVLGEMVRGLGMTEGVALARVWLLRREAEQEPYLELKASFGASLVDPLVRWTRTGGAHQRIPMSYGKVGQIASTNKPLLLQRGPREWLLQPEWADAEQIESFAGQPLAFRGQIVGVVALFSRKRLEAQELGWLRVLADHAAVAIANARAYEEIERLKERAELERDYLREAVRSAPKTPARNGLEGFSEVLPMSAIRDLERGNILSALAQCDFRVSGPRGAAKMLGMRASTLAYRMKQLGIRRPD